jgi:phytoene/squalene synthetase
MGMVAVIDTFADEGASTDIPGDLAHITRRSDRWWRDLILSCGWRQDPLHRALEQGCRRHELPRKMGWQLFVYAS